MRPSPTEFGKANHRPRRGGRRGEDSGCKPQAFVSAISAPRAVKIFCSGTGARTGGLDRRGRAFTLLEMMLAVTLASIVAISAYGLFEIIRRTERRQFVRMGEADEVARAYRAIERAFRTLVMSDKPLPGDEKAVTERLREFERAVDNDEPDPPLDDQEPEPRLVLRPDPSSPQIQAEVEGRAVRMRAQVMEVVVRTPPVLGARPEERVFEVATRGDRRERGAGREEGRGARGGDENRDGRAEATAPGDEEEEQDPPPIAPGVRGVFELLPDGMDPLGALGPATGLEGWKPRESTEPGLTLWWRELPPPAPPPEEEAEGAATVDANGQPVERRDGDAAPRRSREEIEGEQLALLSATRRVPLITGLRWARWEVYRGERFDTRTRATWEHELPGFVKVAFETVEGRKENWMFEVGWTKGAEPGTPLDAASLPNRPPAALDPALRDRPAANRGRNTPRENRERDKE